MATKKCKTCGRQIDPKGKNAKNHALKTGEICMLPRKIKQHKQQGKEYTAKERKNILDSLMPFFLLGYNRTEACRSVGFDNKTLYLWEKKDPSLSIKINAEMSKINTEARRNIINEIKAGNIGISQWWAERREKQAFSTRQEQITDTAEDFRKEDRKREREDMGNISKSLAEIAKGFKSK